jgi:hypothetical protein
MSSGRAAAAIAARRAKQELVRLLFSTGKPKLKTSSLMDISKYSYRDLRSAYLEKLHELHPDKAADATVAKGLFVELQTAWLAYEQISKSFRQSSSESSGAEADFTMFGVGCSFSDNEQEKTLRLEIMDQACRGWFSSGYIGETAAVKNITSARSPGTPLFTYMDEETASPSNEASREGTGWQVDRHKSSLVSDQMHRARRRRSTSQAPSQRNR